MIYFRNHINLEPDEDQSSGRSQEQKQDNLAANWISDDDEFHKLEPNGRSQVQDNLAANCKSGQEQDNIAI